jgi:hypothetical protein
MNSRLFDCSKFFFFKRAGVGVTASLRVSIRFPFSSPLPSTERKYRIFRVYRFPAFLFLSRNEFIVDFFFFFLLTHKIAQHTRGFLQLILAPADFALVPVVSAQRASTVTFFLS